VQFFDQEAPVAAVVDGYNMPIQSDFFSEGMDEAKGMDDFNEQP